MAKRKPFKTLLNDFKKFILKGNMIDMAVGIITSGAFTDVVNFLVSDVIMLPTGKAMGEWI